MPAACCSRASTPAGHLNKFVVMQREQIVPNQISHRLILCRRHTQMRSGLCERKEAPGVGPEAEHSVAGGGADIAVGCGCRCRCARRLRLGLDGEQADLALAARSGAREHRECRAPGARDPRRRGGGARRQEREARSSPSRRCCGWRGFRG